MNLDPTIQRGDLIRASATLEYHLAVTRPTRAEALDQWKRSVMEALAEQGVVVWCESSSAELVQDWLVDDFAVEATFVVAEANYREPVQEAGAGLVLAAVATIVVALVAGYVADQLFELVREDPAGAHELVATAGKASDAARTIALVVLGVAFLWYFGSTLNRAATAAV